MSEYEERKQARIDRYREKAEKARQESRQLSHESISMLEHIPPGQPILVGHHSERGHRNLLKRSDQKMEKSIAVAEKADYYEHKAEAAERNTAIFSDDPEALTKLKEKLEGLQVAQTRMKQINAYYRKHGTCQGFHGLSDEQAEKLDDRVRRGYSWEKTPYPPYALSNNNQEIRRLQARIKQLTEARELGYQGWEFEGGKVVANAENNRLQVFFDKIPSAELRQELKSRGFHWARSEGAWQRQLTDNAIYSASRITAIQPKDGTDPLKIQPKRKPKTGPTR